MKLSVVTISYNQQSFLEQAMRSVIDQRGGPVEVEYIVVDAGSKDGSKELLNRYSDQIDVLRIETDDGPADGLNKGFALATGDVLAFLNADDVLLPGSLGVVAEWFLQRPTVDVLVGGIAIIDENGRLARWGSPFASVVQLPIPFDVERVVEGRFTVLQQATFFRRSAWEIAGGFNVKNHTCWDLELFAQMAADGAVFSRTRDVLGCFRVHSESITGSGHHGEEIWAELKRIRLDVCRSHTPANRSWSSWIASVMFRSRPLHRIGQAAAEGAFRLRNRRTIVALRRQY